MSLEGNEEAHNRCPNKDYIIWRFLKKAFWPIVLLGLCFAACIVPHIVPTHSFFSDLFYKMRSNSPVVDHADVVVVYFDDAFLKQLPYRSPVDRCVIASALHEINSYQPRVIGLDLLVDLASEPAKDQVLVDTAKSLGGRLVIASYTSSLGDDYDPAEFLRELGIPHSQIASATLQKDHDSTVRTAVDSDSGLYPTLARALADRFKGRTTRIIPDPEPFVIDWTPHREQGTLLIRRLPLTLFLHSNVLALQGCPSLTFDTAPPPRSLRNSIQSWLKNKVVIVGADLNFEDRHLTPFDLAKNQRPKLAGVQIHADITQQLIDGRSIGQPGFVLTYLYMLFVFLVCYSVNNWLRANYQWYTEAASNPPSGEDDIEPIPYLAPVLVGGFFSMVVLGLEFVGLVFLDYALPSGLMLIVVGLVFGARFINVLRHGPPNVPQE